jgi:hypothetical protein
MIQKNLKIYLQKVLLLVFSILHRRLYFIGLDFLQGMLVYDTVHRRTIGELTVHPWLTVIFTSDFS